MMIILKDKFMAGKKLRGHTYLMIWDRQHVDELLHVLARWSIPEIGLTPDEAVSIGRQCLKKTYALEEQEGLGIGD